MQKQPKPQKIDWGITIFPLAAIVILSLGTPGGASGV